VTIHKLLGNFEKIVHPFYVKNMFTHCTSSTVVSL